MSSPPIAALPALSPAVYNASPGVNPNPSPVASGNTGAGVSAPSGSVATAHQGTPISSSAPPVPRTAARGVLGTVRASASRLVSAANAKPVRFSIGVPASANNARALVFGSVNSALAAVGSPTLASIVPVIEMPSAADAAVRPFKASAVPAVAAVQNTAWALHAYSRVRLSQK